MRIWNRAIPYRIQSHFLFVPVEFHMHTKRKPCWYPLDIHFFSSLHVHQGACLEYPNSILQSVKLPKCFLSPSDGPFLSVYKALNICLWKFLLVNSLHHSRSGYFVPCFCIPFLNYICIYTNVPHVCPLGCSHSKSWSSISFYLLPHF